MSHHTTTVFTFVLGSLLAILTVTTTTTLAFEITFPSPTNYWVACGWNNMTWKSYTKDPKTVTIMLTNSNKTLLNDDFEIGNALQGSDNAAMVYVPCLPATSGYSLMFVNPDHYDHKQNKVLYTSSQFVIKAKGTAPDSASGQSSIPSEIQPYLQTPGIVLPPGKPDDVINTTATANGTTGALPRLDGSSASFGSFKPVPHNSNGATAQHVLGDLLFVAVVAAFTTLVVTS